MPSQFGFGYLFEELSMRNRARYAANPVSPQSDDDFKTLEDRMVRSETHGLNGIYKYKRTRALKKMTQTIRQGNCDWHPGAQIL